MRWRDPWLMQQIKPSHPSIQVEIIVMIRRDIAKVKNEVEKVIPKSLSEY
jgi:hypothetical protein